MTLSRHEDAERLRMLVGNKLGGRVRYFRVVCLEDGLALQGEVGCFYLKQMAQQSVMAATAFRIVANEIAVE